MEQQYGLVRFAKLLRPCPHYSNSIPNWATLTSSSIPYIPQNTEYIQSRPLPCSYQKMDSPFYFSQKYLCHQIRHLLIQFLQFAGFLCTLQLFQQYFSQEQLLQCSLFNVNILFNTTLLRMQIRSAPARTRRAAQLALRNLSAIELGPSTPCSWLKNTRLCPSLDLS